MIKKFDENGKLVEVQEKGEKILNTQDLRRQLEDVNGNPQMKSIIKDIITYIEKNG